MPSVILSDNGVSSGSAGLKSTAASDGALALQTTTAGGSATTAALIDTSQNVLVGMSSYGVTNAGVSLSPTASSSFYVAGGTAVTIGRGVSNGTAVQFNRSGTNVGTIDVATTGLTMTGTNGITFTAAQSASSDANTLDDYEEGTWTPTINLLGTITYAVRSGTYTKIGRQVTINLYLAFSSSNTTQNNSTIFYITGLPFASAFTQNGCLVTERMYGYSSPSAPNTFFAEVSDGQSQLYIVQNNYNGSIANASYYAGSFLNLYQGGTLYMRGNITYFV